MPNFTITGPDGKKYKVSGETAEGALQALQQHLGETPSAPDLTQSMQPQEPSMLQSAANAVSGLTPLGMGKNIYEAGKAAIQDPAAAFQAVDDTVRTAANGATFGLADRFAGYMNGPQTSDLVTGQSPLERERAHSEASRERLGPVMAPAAEIAGSMLPVSKLMGMGVTATRLPGMVGKYLGNTIDAAAIGGAQAAGNDEDILKGAAFGSVAGAGSQLVGKAFVKALSKVPKNMSVDDLQGMAKRAYDRADKAGVVFKPEAIGNLASRVQKDFAEFGYHPELQPGAKVALGELERLVKGGNVNLKGLDTARKIAQQAYIPMNKANNALVAKVIRQIDDFATKATPDEVLMGDAVAGSAALKEARNLWHRASKLDTVDDLLEKAGRRAARTGSGGNIENTTRQNLSKILDSEAKSRGFTADEKAALEKAVYGTKTGNTLRQLGKFSPMGNGLIATLQALTALGASAAGAPMAAPLILGGAAAGTGAKLTSEAMQRSAVKKIQQLISSGGKASAMMKPRLSKGTEEQIKQLVKMLMVGGATQAPQLAN